MHVPLHDLNPNGQLQLPPSPEHTLPLVQSFGALQHVVFAMHVPLHNLNPV